MSKFQSKTIKQFKEAGYYVIKLHKTNYNGIPDLMCLKDGKAIFIEVKEANDTLKELQKYRIDELIKLGFMAGCVKDRVGVIYGNLKFDMLDAL